MGGSKFRKAPPKPPKKVRKFCCLESFNRHLPRDLPIKPEIALICRKYQLFKKLIHPHAVLSWWVCMGYIVVLGQIIYQKALILDLCN